VHTVIAFLHIVIAGLALFLIGANGAFLLHLGSRLVPWFTIKIGAVTLLLAYVAASALWGDPQTLRLLLGFVAVAVDVYALYRMWASITDLSRRGVTGLVPLIVSRQDDEDRVH
jgi:hypothetical protein